MNNKIKSLLAGAALILTISLVAPPAFAHGVRHGGHDPKKHAKKRAKKSARKNVRRRSRARVAVHREADRRAHTH